ncbi:GrpE nucleotide exchange factor protein [Dioscorea alata]|nr:GrpE nucleotide exchange factor protein [Dioscorea alata]KAH7680939.1 GrpE nucleotide exchange factor protein [Dioscorea alata]
MKTLVQAYKKAILDGDEKSAYEVEAAICIMENEKNDLSLKLSEMLAEITTGKDKLLRLKADFENFRKRSENDRITFTSDFQGDVIENLLPIVDSFEKARQQIKPETEKEKKIDTSYQGIYKQFVEVMRYLGVAVIATVGKPFDPSIHEAVGREESQEIRAGIVMQELRRGFVLGEKLLRPATVKVSTGPGPVKVPPNTEKSTEQSTEMVQPADDPASTINTS